VNYLVSNGLKLQLPLAITELYAEAIKMSGRWIRLQMKQCLRIIVMLFSLFFYMILALPLIIIWWGFMPHAKCPECGTNLIPRDQWCPECGSHCQKQSE